jgi:hypothetical protein
MMSGDRPYGGWGALFKGECMRRMRRWSMLATAVVLVMAPGVGWAHPDHQHGVQEGHLLGPGAWGNIELLSVERLTDTPELVADVTVSPDGQTAFLAN